MPFGSSRTVGVHTKRSGIKPRRQFSLGIGIRPHIERTHNHPCARSIRKVGAVEVSLLRGDISVIDTIASEWDDLCMEGPSREPFFTPTWIRAWIGSFAPSSTVVLIVARREGQLRSVLPLIEQHIGYRGLLLTRMVSPSNYHSGRADLIHGAGDRNEVANAVWDTLNHDLRWDILEYRDVIEESGFSQIAIAAKRDGNKIIKRETQRSPYLAFDLATDLGKVGPAKGIRRTQRLLAKDGEYHVRRTAPADLGSFERLVHQEDSGWKGKAGTAIARQPAVLAFYTAIVSAQPRSFTTVANEIVFEGEPIAIALGIEMGDRYFGIKPTYSEAHHRYGPGQLIQHEILVGLPSRSITEFDMMGSNQAYKMAWTSTVRHHYHYLIFRRSLKGNILRRSVEQLVPLVKYWRTWLQSRRAQVGRNPKKDSVETTSAT